MTCCPSLVCLLAMLHVMQKRIVRTNANVASRLLFFFFRAIILYFISTVWMYPVNSYVYKYICVYIVCFKVRRETWSSDVTIKPRECSNWFCPWCPPAEDCSSLWMNLRLFTFSVQSFSVVTLRSDSDWLWKSNVRFSSIVFFFFVCICIVYFRTHPSLFYFHVVEGLWRFDWRYCSHCQSSECSDLQTSSIQNV